MLCVWGTPPADALVNAASHGRDLPLIVLYFGRMWEKLRRELAYACRPKGPSLLAIDESLVFYLCGQRDPLPAVFRCTLPFVPIRPYTTTASLVPPEMFFGRDSAIQNVINPHGTNLVYGGRQLGKTAMLRHVERRYHRPEEGSIVCWIDLQAEEVGGANRPIEDLWPVIARTLHREGVVASPNISVPQTLHDKVCKWLDESPQRRIVLLLDEADDFLDEDSKGRSDRSDEGFPHLLLLKRLMDATERRFKVVFAGLHNVQRTSRDPNTPIAHLGQPCSIGPLLEGGESKDALELIEVPFRRLGYRFASTDLPMRILSHTNWYPSLIQLFCKHLLDHLLKDTSFDPRSSPPYAITAQHLDDAYQDSQLREAILDRFNKTLDLDPRYHLIALCIALQSSDRAAAGALVHGVDVTWVREQALAWWNEGFREDDSLDALRNLLDEMVGLGVLRRVVESDGNVSRATNRYALRSPNVLDLMGNQNEIEDALLDAARRTPPQPYEPSRFRSASDDRWRRSPLTAQQESELLKRDSGVGVIFGSAAAGLDDVPEFLEAACRQEGRLQVLDSMLSVGDFRRRLADDFDHSDEGMLLLVVPAASNWSERYVVAAQDFLSRKRSRKRYCRVLFLADSRITWQWTQLDSDDLHRLASRDLLEFMLRPWHDSAVRRWMLDANFGPDNDDGRQFCRQVTANWGSLLHELGRRCRETGLHHWEEHLHGLDGELQSAEARWDQHFDFHPRCLPTLRVMAELNEPLTIDDIEAFLADDEGREFAGRAVAWADRLSYVRQVGPQRYQLDPVVHRLVANS